MGITHTRTYVKLAVCNQTYQEVKQKLLAAGYDHAFHHDGQELLIDMHGIALSNEKPKQRPKAITIIGSSRFVEVAADKAWELEKQGNIVFNMHLLPQWYLDAQPFHQVEEEKVAAILDEINLRKIDLSDEIFVVNVDGYIGKRTQVEIDYADEHGKPVTYLEVGMNHSNPDWIWRPFTKDFDYDKKFYDVRLPDGTIIEQCWPNAGIMNAINGDCRKVTPEDNAMVRISIKHPMDD